MFGGIVPQPFLGLLKAVAEHGEIISSLFAIYQQRLVVRAANAQDHVGVGEKLGGIYLSLEPRYELGQVADVKHATGMGHIPKTLARYSTLRRSAAITSQRSARLWF